MTGISWLQKLYSEQQFFHEKKISSLDEFNTLLDHLGRPDASYDYRVVIGGTAGKGTLCYGLEDLLSRSDVSTLMLTSPHLMQVNERVRLNGTDITDLKLDEILLQIKKVSDSIEIVPTYYEAMILVGMVYGSQEQAKVLIAEVGLGGEFDAVNAVQGQRISVVTFIGEDHLDIFKTLRGAADTKSKIFTPESVLNLSYEKEFQGVFRKNASPHSVEFIKGVPTKYNQKILKRIGRHILGSISFTLQKVQIPARWEKFDIDGIQYIIDGAHSKPRFEFIKKKVEKLTGKTVCIFGMTKNHDVRSFSVIESIFDQVIMVPLEDLGRSHSVKSLAGVFPKSLESQDLVHALDIAKKMNPDKILITGSLYLCGMARRLLC